MADTWRVVLLGDICSIQARLVDPTLPEYQDMLHVGIERIESGTGRLLPLATAAEDGVTSGKYLFTAEDVIYSKIRPELRKAAFPRFSGLASADAYPLRVGEQCLPEFLHLLLLSPAFSEAAMAKSGRTKMPKINRGELFSIPVNLPPLPEQRRIVDLIGALDAEIEALKAERRAVHLVWASLVEDVGPGVERVQLGQVLLRIDAGKSPSGDERPPGPAEKAVLKVNAIEQGRFNAQAVKTVSSGVSLPEVLAVRRGDVLMVRANGVLSRVGQVCQVNIEPERLYLCDKTLRLVANPDVLLPAFLRHVLSSQGSREQIEALTTGSHMRNLSQQAIRQLEIPVPALEEQISQAEALDACLDGADALDREVDCALVLRQELLTATLGGTHEVPPSYDALLPEAV